MATLNRTFSVKNGIDVANTIIVDSSRNVSNIPSLNVTGTMNSATANITTIITGNTLTVSTGTASNGNIVFSANGTEDIRIVSNGSIGIGTTTPNARMELSSDSGRLRITQNVAGNVFNGIDFAGYTGGVSAGLLLNQSTGELRINAAASYFPTIYSNGTEAARITTTGNVGIGTSNPSYKLEVNGAFAATTKSFVIPHPTKPGMKLRYGSLEGPENGVYIRGRANTNTIPLPDYWEKLVDPNSITVSLTPVGSYTKLYVKEVNKDHIVVGKGFFGSFDYFYTVYAERNDVDKLTVEI